MYLAAFFFLFVGLREEQRKTELFNFKRQARSAEQTWSGARDCDYSRRKWGHRLVMTFTKRFASPAANFHGLKMGDPRHAAIMSQLQNETTLIRSMRPTLYHVLKKRGINRRERQRHGFNVPGVRAYLIRNVKKGARGLSLPAFVMGASLHHVYEDFYDA